MNEIMTDLGHRRADRRAFGVGVKMKGAAGRGTERTRLGDALAREPGRC